MRGDNSGRDYIGQNIEKSSYKHKSGNAFFTSYPPFFFFTKYFISLKWLDQLS